MAEDTRDGRAVAATSLPIPAPRADRAVGPRDALTAYMAELRHYPPISREEEHELAVRWVEHGDRDAARRLVLANLRLVVKIAMEYRRAWTNVLDLIQDGNVGLLEAVQRYDPYQGVKLSTYAVYWIRAYILQYILDNFRIVRLGTTRAQRKLFWRLNKEKRELERQGFEAEPRLIAERLDVTEAEVEDMDMRLRESDLSMNMPARRDEPGRRGRRFHARRARRAPRRTSPTRSSGASSSRRCRSSRRRSTSATASSSTGASSPTSRRRSPSSAREFGVSRERVRQLEARIVERLREYLKENLVDFEYYAAPSG